MVQSQHDESPACLFYGPPTPACPRCEDVMTRPLPRVTTEHAAWRECLACHHIWLSRYDEQTTHQHLYGRS